jgi:hypothetical protein
MAKLLYLKRRVVKWEERICWSRRPPGSSFTSTLHGMSAYRCLLSSPFQIFQWQREHEWCARQENGQLPGSRASWNRFARKGGKKGPSRPALVKRVSRNPAEMGTPWEETRRNPFQM